MPRYFVSFFPETSKRHFVILSVAVAISLLIAILALVFAILASPDGQSGATSDACASSPCGGLSTCTQVGPNGFACQCDHNHEGKTCTQVLEQGNRPHNEEYSS